MIRALAVASAALLWAAIPAKGHRLDEYLQATMFLVEQDRIQAQMYLTPGVAVFASVLAKIDANGDGTISAPEQRAYAQRVLRDLSLTIDGKLLRLKLVSTNFADLEALKEGRGDMRIEFTADVPHGGRNRSLIYENRHESRIAAYLVNCLMQRDSAIQVTAQRRNYQQSLYQMDYVQASVRQEPLSPSRRLKLAWVGTAGLLLLAPLALMRRQRP